MRYFHGDRSIPLIPFGQSVVERPGVRRASAPFLRCATTRPLVMSLALSLALGSPRSAVAQTLVSASASNPVLITGHDMLLIAGATAASAAVSAFDVSIARRFTDSVFHSQHPGLRTAALRASQVTETVLMITGGLVYGIARASKDQGTADVALHTTESVFAAAMAIQVVRGALGRSRPHILDDRLAERRSDPYHFRPFRGFTSFEYRSFPSMHAMASFAVASALAQEMRQRDTPHRGVIAPLLYLGAATPAVSRMYLDEHWASDIAMGVFLGVFAGQKAVMYSHDHPDNRIDRRLLKTQVRAVVSHGASGFSFSLAPF